MTELSERMREDFEVKAKGEHAQNAADNLDSVAKAVPESKVISLEECKQHAREEDCWLVIHGKVLDVTSFLDEHPGGFDIIISSTGKDATEDFDEIGHSKAANEMLKKFEIGDFQGGESKPSKPADILKARVLESPPPSTNPLLKLLQVFLPVLVILAAIYLPRLLFPPKQ